mmetsp:Transcript_20028/g.17705  ORF Transcript_20028/g.17705 Transcript_20028/m.17705 type:complete len:102 (+) Transcript_20028:242-547(+)
MIEQIPENLEDSMVDNLEDQSSILTIDLYLSLEKKREEENERIRNMVSSSEQDKEEGSQIKLNGEESSFEIPPSKMPLNLIKGSRKVDKIHVKNKLSLFAE